MKSATSCRKAKILGKKFQQQAPNLSLHALKSRNNNNKNFLGVVVLADKQNNTK